MNYPRDRASPVRREVVYPPEAVAAWVHPDSRNYLLSRGITKEQAEYYDLGYCTEGKWRERVIIPIYFDSKLECLQGRTLHKNEELRYITEGWRSCYAPNEIALERRLVVVEGPFDLLAVSRIHRRTLATLGNVPSEAQLDQIRSIDSITEISILYDKEALAEAYALQLILNTYLPTEVLTLEEGKDAGECSDDQIR